MQHHQIVVLPATIEKVTLKSGHPCEVPPLEQVGGWPVIGRELHVQAFEAFHLGNAQEQTS